MIIEDDDSILAKKLRSLKNIQQIAETEALAFREELLEEEIFLKVKKAFKDIDYNTFSHILKIEEMLRERQEGE